MSVTATSPTSPETAPVSTVNLSTPPSTDDFPCHQKKGVRIFLRTPFVELIKTSYIVSSPTEARISKSKIAKAARANQTCLSFAESRWHSTKSTAIRPLGTSSHSQTEVNLFSFRHIIVFISQTIKGYIFRCNLSNQI